jgi:predicted deacylase
MKEGSKMQKILEVGNTKAKPGEIAKGSLGSVELADGSKATIPLINVNGIKDGPIFAIITGVHGTEVSGVAALLRLIKNIDPNSMRGALLGIPGANPLALRAGTYVAHDRINLSNPWYLSPIEREKASVTMRMVSYISEALERADYVIDVHANPLPAIGFVLTNMVLCKNEKVREKTKRMVEAIGLTIVDWSYPSPRGLFDTCLEHGKATAALELPGNFYAWDEITDIGVRGLMNVMKAIGMLDGQVEKQDVKVLKGDFKFYGWLHAQRGGLMFVKKEPGEKIEKGETAIEIVDIYGDIVDEVKMPITGYCWSFTPGGGGVGITHAVSEGHRLAYVFTEASELGEGQRFVEKPF